jgi:hypothetical protein
MLDGEMSGACDTHGRRAYTILVGKPDLGDVAVDGRLIL